eukprot:Colp12_sorted_trinity150504_noHs@24681
MKQENMESVDLRSSSTDKFAKGEHHQPAQTEGIPMTDVRRSSISTSLKDEPGAVTKRRTSFANAPAYPGDATINMEKAMIENGQIVTGARPDGNYPLAESATMRSMNRQSGQRKDFHYKIFKTPKEVVQALVGASIKKSKVPYDKLFFLGVFAGFFVGLGGIFGVAASAFPPEFNAAYPPIPKLILGFTFPIALVLIIVIGGELYTGNTMYMVFGVLSRKIRFKSLLINWVFAWTANFVGCLLVAYFLGYLTDIFATDPWLTFVQNIAHKKVSKGFGITFLRAIGANWYVCLAVFIVIAAEDVVGKFVATLMIIAAFVAAGFEHVIANMFFIPLGMMYGADVTVADFIVKNLIPVTLGNTFGGAILCGATLWFLYIYRDETRVLSSIRTAASEFKTY